jgi:peptide/nickel transport system permease protein
MKDLLRGDLGDSLLSGRSVADELGDRISLTLHLALLSLAIALLMAIPIGIISAVCQDTVADYGGRLFSVLGLSLPDFWSGVVAILILSLWFHWLPPRGFEGIWAAPIKTFQQLLIPAAIIGFRFSAVIMRMTRSSMLEVLREDYIRTARSKGLSEQKVIVGHAMKNSFIPVVTLIGQQFSILLGGTVIIETIFLLPGVGNMTLDAVLFRDYTLVQGAVIFFGGIMVLMNLLVDISYAWFDPRIRYG